MTWPLAIGTVRGTVVRVHVRIVAFLVRVGMAHHRRGSLRQNIGEMMMVKTAWLCQPPPMHAAEGFPVPGDAPGRHEPGRQPAADRA